MASALLKHFDRLPRISRMSIRSKLLLTLIVFGAAAVAAHCLDWLFQCKT